MRESGTVKLMMGNMLDAFLRELLNIVRRHRQGQERDKVRARQGTVQV